MAETATSHCILDNLSQPLPVLAITITLRFKALGSAPASTELHHAAWPERNRNLFADLYCIVSCPVYSSHAFLRGFVTSLSILSWVISHHFRFSTFSVQNLTNFWVFVWLMDERRGASTSERNARNINNFINKTTKLFFFNICSCLQGGNKQVGKNTNSRVCHSLCQRVKWNGTDNMGRFAKSLSSKHPWWGVPS